MTTRRIFFSFVVLSVLAGALQAFQADPPDRAARLNYYQGSLSFRPASLDDWAPVSRNYPLTVGDEIWAEDGSRGEIHVGRGTVLRLGPRTAFSFLNLDDDTTQVRVSEGTLSLTVNRLDDDEVVEVDTPNAAISVLRPGFYRVDVDEQRYETRVTVRQGEAEVLAGGGAVPVSSGEALLVSGDEYDPRYDLRDAYARDAWEDWAVERDRREERFESRRYVSHDMVGYEDLDEYGRWSDYPDYGRVWMPRNVAADWAPYRYGHWAWVQPWGWTWIDDAPWGFAPFHYGRWARLDNGWAWLPGSSLTRAVYAPALVAFLDDLSLSIGGTGLGWLPLGPRDVYVPWYQASPGYIRSVNQPYVPNFTAINPANITYSYVHLNTPGAVTAVNRDVFVGGRHVARAATVVPAQQARRARVRPSVVESLKPRRESIVGAAAAQASAPRPPAKVRERPVVVRASPPPPPKRLVGEGRMAAASPPPVRPAAREGQPAKLRPVREGLPTPRAIRPGEWRRREPGREPERARERPSPPAAEPSQRELPKTREPQREPERETPPATRPQAPRSPGAQPREPDDARKREQPPAASPAPVEPRREPAKPQDRARDPRQPSRESPPAARPEPPKPPTDDLKERARQPDRSKERPPAASPAPAAQPKEPARPEDRERRQRERSREQPAAQPEASKPPAASPSPVAQPTEPAKPQDKAREQRSPAREKEKAKGKPTPKPTPTPTPEAEGRRRRA